MRFGWVLFLVACGGGATDSGTAAGVAPGTTSGTTTTTTPSHDADIQAIWEESCGTTCHIDDDDGDLQIGTDGYDQLVGVPSVDIPGMDLVSPGSLDDSYLWHKIEGTHLTVGGAGSAMPRGSSELKKRDRKAIKAWIEGGAPR